MLRDIAWVATTWRLRRGLNNFPSRA